MSFGNFGSKPMKTPKAPKAPGKKPFSSRTVIGVRGKGMCFGIGVTNHTVTLGALRVILMLRCGVALWRNPKVKASVQTSSGASKRE